MRTENKIFERRERKRGGVVTAKKALNKNKTQFIYFTKMTEIIQKDWSALYAKEEKRFETAIILQAEVVHGFKRGSKELGIPTANLSMEELGDTGNKLDTGIYYGWATLPSGKYPTVVSVGWNPFYKNVKKTVEAHLLQPMEDFYGERISLELLGYLRNEQSFSSLGDLLVALHYSLLISISLNR